MGGVVLVACRRLEVGLVEFVWRELVRRRVAEGAAVGSRRKFEEQSKERQGRSLRAPLLRRGRAEVGGGGCGGPFVGWQ